MRFKNIGIIAAALAILGSVPSIAKDGEISKMECLPRVEIVSALTEGFGERSVAVGQIDALTVMEIFAAPDGSWTLLTTNIHGGTCVMTFGDGWEMTPIVLGDPT